MKLEKDTTISHYKILSEIGKGGMGEVYLAQDTKLNRQVAIKFLSDEFSKDADKLNRFVQEAQAASALNHPNIITIHEIGETNNTQYIALEYIEGETLTARLKNKLKFNEALEIATQIASALDAAHSAGIVHRDIKPDNVMIREDGLVKILDFGIAKLTEKSSQEIESEDKTAIQVNTTPGMIIGTANYMSPEQAKGEAVDPRTDIFSFGVVLYEMIDGHLPFEGKTAMEMISSVLKDEPKPLNDSDIHPDLKGIIAKTLKKDRNERYSKIKELLADLKSLKKRIQFEAELARTTSPDRGAEERTQILKAATDENPSVTQTISTQNSIAVLPFTNMSSDEDNEYFCDGLAEELLNAFSKIEDLKVAARTSAFSFKGKNANVSEIGEKLSVKNVLEGSVRRSGDQLRISVQLVSATEGYQIWSERYDREMKDIFDVQDEIALAVVDALKLKLFGDEKAEISKLKPNSSEALDLYLKGRFHFHKITPEGWQKAIEYFQKAIEKDPDYALAYAGLSSVLTFYSFFGVVSAVEIIPQAKNAAQRALEINDKLDEAHVTLAQIYMFYEWNLEQADQEFRKAIKLNPQNAYGRYEYGLCLAVMTKQEQAILEAEKAIELEPLSLLANFQVTAIYYELGLFEESTRYAERMIEMTPDFYGGYLFKGLVLIAQEKFNKAIQMLEKSLSLDEEQYFTKSSLGQAYGLAGNENKALELIKEIQNENRNGYVTPFHIARIYSSIRDLDKTFEWLEKAFDERNGELVYLKINSTFGNGNVWGKELVADKRFQNLLRRMGFSTGLKIQTDESFEAETVMLSTGEATTEPSMEDSDINRLETKSTTGSTNNPKFKIQNPKSTWWLFGLLGLIVLVGGFFGYKYLSPTKQIESIAVMPFVNGTGDTQVEYLSDGMTDTLISSLSKIPALSVKASSTVFYYKGKNFSAKQIGDELKVDAVLLGKVVKKSSDISLRLELVEVSTERVLWSESYNRKMEDLAKLQKEIANKVTRQLKFKLTGEEVEKLSNSTSTNPEAFQALLKGRHHWRKRGEKGLETAIEFFEKAIRIDPNYALAWSGLADSYSILPAYTTSMLPRDAMPKARAAAENAVRLGPNLAEAHVSLGMVLVIEGKREEGIAEYKKAIELDPKYATARHWLANVLADLRRDEESIAQFRTAVELEPLAIVINRNFADTLYRMRSYRKAEAQYKKVLEIDPESARTLRRLGTMLAFMGRFKEALAALNKSAALGDESAKIKLGIARVLEGNEKKAREILAIESGRAVHSPAALAEFYAMLDERERAFELIDLSTKESSVDMSKNIRSPEFDNLRQDPRFEKAVLRLGLPVK